MTRRNYDALPFVPPDPEPVTPTPWTDPPPLPPMADVEAIRDELCRELVTRTPPGQPSVDDLLASMSKTFDEGEKAELWNVLADRIGMRVCPSPCPDLAEFDAADLPEV